MEDRGTQTSDTEEGDPYVEIWDPVAVGRVALELHHMDVNNSKEAKQV